MKRYEENGSINSVADPLPRRLPSSLVKLLLMLGVFSIEDAAEESFAPLRWVIVVLVMLAVWTHAPEFARCSLPWQ